MNDIFEKLSLICFAAGGILFAVSVFIWFKFRIFNIISDLSGRSERLSLKKLRKDSSVLHSSDASPIENSLMTDKLITGSVGNRAQDTVLLSDDGGGETQLMDTECGSKGDETCLLSENDEEIYDNGKAADFEIVESIELFTSDETI